MAAHSPKTPPGNWNTALATARTTGNNIYCSIVALNNGATNTAVGARYKGNSSYSMAGTKKSINLQFDWVNTNANLMNYETVNLNNAAGDETCRPVAAPGRTEWQLAQLRPSRM